MKKNLQIPTANFANSEINSQVPPVSLKAELTVSPETQHSYHEFTSCHKFQRKRKRVDQSETFTSILIHNINRCSPSYAKVLRPTPKHCVHPISFSVHPVCTRF